MLFVLINSRIASIMPNIVELIRSKQQEKTQLKNEGEHSNFHAHQEAQDLDLENLKRREQLLSDVGASKILEDINAQILQGNGVLRDNEFRIYQSRNIAHDMSSERYGHASSVDLVWYLGKGREKYTRKREHYWGVVSVQAFNYDYEKIGVDPKPLAADCRIGSHVTVCKKTDKKMPDYRMIALQYRLDNGYSGPTACQPSEANTIDGLRNQLVEDVATKFVALFTNTDTKG